MSFEDFKARVEFLAQTVDKYKLDVLSADGMTVQKSKHIFEADQPETIEQPKTITSEQIAEMSWSLSHAGRY